MPLTQRHRGQADDRLARPTRQHDHAAAPAHVAAGIEDVGRVALVVADLKRQPRSGDLPQPDRQVRSLGVAGQVFRGIADADQRELQDAAVRRVDAEAPCVEPLAEVLPELRLPRQLLEQPLVGADQSQAVVELFQPHTSVAADQLLQIDRQVARQRELAVAREHPDHLLGRHPGSGGVPERKRRNSVRVDVFGALFQLGKRRQGVPGGRIFRVIDLYEYGPVALNDEGVGRIGGGEDVRLPRRHWRAVNKAGGWPGGGRFTVSSAV